MISPTGGRVAELEASPVPELSTPRLKFWLGEREAKKVIEDVGTIRRISLVQDHKLVMAVALDEPLDLEGVEIFEAQLGLQFVNTKQPRYGFDT